MAITEFHGKYICLSNFAPVIGRLTVEHWYQANRTENKDWQRLIMDAPNAAEAKRLGNEVRKAGLERADWHKVNWHIMYHLVFVKMLIRPDYRLVLLGTGDEELMEGNWWHDNYWGRCICENCKPKEKFNNLGLIHMLLRHLFGTYQVIPELTIRS